MAFDAFLKIGTIPGESTDSKHKEWIELAEYSFGVKQPAAGSRSDGGAATGGRADFDNFTCKKNLDKASPKLMLSCAKGEHIKEIKVELCRATGDKQPYLEIKYSDVIITVVKPAGSGTGEGLPTEDLEFNFGKVE